ncbi:hypothetical protein UPYG_G00233180 [Umbra pygmaea]|uniref:C2H2-type domain-containing protein n=1 Tax=Umbra pygmaea TaxID=75934 RepID=A0ABD0WDV7_UMBPY
MNQERERLLDEIELSLYTLTDDNIRYLCRSCGIGGIDGSEVKGKSLRSLRRIIGEYCENVNLMDPEDQGISRLLQLKDDIKEIKKDVPSPSRSMTAESALTQKSCVIEQNSEGGVRMTKERKLTEPAPEWLIVANQRKSPDRDGEPRPWSVQRDATVLLKDCRLVLGQRINLKVEAEEERISGFSHKGQVRHDSSHSSVEELSTTVEQHQAFDKGERSPERSQRKRRCTTRARVDYSLSSYQCPECKKRFSSNAGLQKHIRIHSGERLFQCSHCDKNFINSSNLYQHLPVHSGEKPHHCSDCGRTFSTSRYLTKHKRIHSGIKPFCCVHCDKRYTRSDQLKVHMMTHTGERPYQCGQCEKRFKMKANLKDHLLLHEVEISLCCPECDQRFSTVECLKEHIGLHTAEKPVHCLQCEKKYCSPKEFKEHMNSHNEGQPVHSPEPDNRLPSLRNVKDCDTVWHSVEQSSVVIQNQEVKPGEKPFHLQRENRIGTSDTLKEHDDKKLVQCTEPENNSATKNVDEVYQKMTHAVEKPTLDFDCEIEFAQQDKICNLKTQT